MKVYTSLEHYQITEVLLVKYVRELVFVHQDVFNSIRICTLLKHRS